MTADFFFPVILDEANSAEPELLLQHFSWLNSGVNHTPSEPRSPYQMEMILTFSQRMLGVGDVGKALGTVSS